MRCCCCDVNLTEFESTRKSAVTGDYLDMCNKCIKGLGIATLDRGDLQNAGERSSIYDDPDFLDWGFIIEEGDSPWHDEDNL